MHIPDGFLDTKTVVTTTALSLTGVAAAWRQTKSSVEPQRIPLLGVTAAFVFAAQMLNFPVAGGTSGHLMGAVLCSVLIGPGGAIIVMTSVLVVQCLLFADGGVLALGANIFNMGIVGTLTGSLFYHGLHRFFPSRRGRIAAVALASWSSVVVASMCCAGELAWSGTVQWRIAFPAMTGVHAVIGVGEALISCLVIVAVQKARPELVPSSENPRSVKKTGVIVVYGLTIAVGLVIFISPFASQWPDGLEKVAATFGFDTKAIQHPIASKVIPDYHFPGVSSLTLATILGGVVGVGVVFLLVRLATRMLRPKSEV